MKRIIAITAILAVLVSAAPKCNLDKGFWLEFRKG